MEQLFGFIDSNGNYYEADKNITGATEVPCRPSQFHSWVNGAWAEDTPAALAAAIEEKVADIEGWYQVALQAPIAYMGAVFQADETSQTLLTKSLTTLNAVGAVPVGFGWWDSSNALVSMTLLDLNGLAQAMLTRGWGAFQKKQTLKATARGMTSVAALTAIVW